MPQHASQLAANSEQRRQRGSFQIHHLLQNVSTMLGHTCYGGKARKGSLRILQQWIGFTSCVAA